MKKKRFCFTLVSLFSLLLGMGLAAVAAQAEENREGATLQTETRLLSNEQLSGSQGEYTVGQVGASMSYQAFKLRFEDVQYHWDDAKLKDLPFGNGKDQPWQHLHHLELSAAKEVRVNPDWSFSLDGGLLAAYESRLGGWGGRLDAWAGYHFSPDLRLRLGGRGYVHQGGMAVLIPGLALDINQERVEGFSASLGVPDAHLKYAFSPQAALRLAAWLENETYRLAEDSPVRPDGYLATTRYLSGLFLDLRPVAGLELSLGLTRSLGGTLTTYDKDGDNSKDYDLEGAWGGVLSLSYRF